MDVNQEVLVKMQRKKSGVRSGNWGGCEPRIEVIVKMQNKSLGVVGSGMGCRGGMGYRGLGDVNQELKVMLNVHIVQY